MYTNTHIDTHTYIYTHTCVYVSTGRSIILKVPFTRSFPPGMSPTSRTRALVWAKAIYTQVILVPPYSPRLFIRSVGPKATFQNVGYFLLVSPSLTWWIKHCLWLGFLPVSLRLSRNIAEVLPSSSRAISFSNCSSLNWWSSQHGSPIVTSSTKDIAGFR